jgi:hypothetical protein
VNNLYPMRIQSALIIDQEGYSLVCTSKALERVKLNNSAEHLLRLCNGENSLSEIIKNIRPYVSQSSGQVDDQYVDDVMRTVFEFQRQDLITFSRCPSPPVPMVSVAFLGLPAKINTEKNLFIDLLQTRVSVKLTRVDDAQVIIAYNQASDSVSARNPEAILVGVKTDTLDVKDPEYHFMFSAERKTTSTNRQALISKRGLSETQPLSTLELAEANKLLNYLFGEPSCTTKRLTIEESHTKQTPCAQHVVFTIALGDATPYAPSIKSIERYADRINADFICLTEPLHPSGISWSNSRFYREAVFQKTHAAKLLLEYERVLYIDADVLITPDAPDIFKSCPDTKQTYLAYESHWDSREDAINSVTDLLADLPNWREDHAGRLYYNAGVMLFSQSAPFFDFVNKDDMVNCIKNVPMEDQTYFAYMINKNCIPIAPLPWKFNWVCVAGPYKQRFKAFFIHYAGAGFDAVVPKAQQIHQDYQHFYGQGGVPDVL